MAILKDWILISYFSFVLFVVMRGKRWLCAVPRASLSVPTIVVIKRHVSFDVSTKYNIPLKEDRIDPRLRGSDKKPGLQKKRETPTVKGKEPLLTHRRRSPSCRYKYRSKSRERQPQVSRRGNSRSNKQGSR